MVSKVAIAIPIAVGAAGLSVYALLTYHRQNKKKDDEIPIKDWTEHRMVINKAYIQLVLGQLEFIKRASSTLINVLKIADEDETFSIVMKGTPESVQEAEFMVNRLIETSPEITTSVIEVPKEKIKLVVSDFGSNLLAITQETGSKLFLKCDPDFYEASDLYDPDVVSKLSNDYFAVSPFYIEIQGPREKNAIAYELIRQTLGKDPSAIPPPTNRWDEIPKESPLDIINASQQSKFVEVTVSAITSVNRFYVQLDRLNSALIKMERRIADHFSIPIGNLYKVTKPYKGAMIAVPNAKHGKWYRAMIVSKDKNSVDASTVRAMFVDYGDVEDVKMDEIRSLPSMFSRYPFFAVECSLAGVLPKTLNPEGLDEWSEEALDFFESLLSDKPNKLFMARKHGEYERVSRNSRTKSGKKWSYKVPALIIIDTNTSEDVDIAIELISKGYARSSGGNEKEEKPPNKLPVKPKFTAEIDNEDSEEFDMP